MFKKTWILNSLAIAGIFSVNSTFACGQCEYSDSLGICWPYDKCVIPNPVPVVKKVLNLGAAITTGDPKQITQAVGDVLVNSPGCLGCASVAHTLLPNLTDAQINQAVGQGFLTFVATGDPVLVTIDVVTNIARQQKIKEDDEPPLPGPAATAPIRKTQTYTATAQCLVTYKDGTVYAGWTDPASFTDVKGKTVIYPAVDLLPDDTVTLTSPICPTWNNPSQGVIAVTSATMKFSKVSTLAGDKQTIKWFIYGKRI